MANKQKTEIPTHLLVKKEDQLRKRSEDFISIYSNNVSVSLSSWDMLINFGRIIQTSDQNFVQEKVEIILSKEMAKLLTILLADHLKQYEANFGEIKIPNLEVLASMQSADKPKKKED